MGKIILADGVPERYAAVLKEALETQAPFSEIERKYFRATHADVGAICWHYGGCLFHWWKPWPTTTTLAAATPGNSVLAGVVHIANALQQIDPAHPEVTAALVDMEYLKLIGLDRQFETSATEYSN